MLTAHDCDDNDNKTYPGAASAEPTLCATDVDGDGYGDSTPANTDIDAGTDCDDTQATLNNTDSDQDGVTTCDGDCNDNDIAINTQAQEVCDSEDTDEDCDGLCDNG